MEFTKAKCRQCGHRWLPHVDKPKKCPNPKCQRIDWDNKKREKYARKAGKNGHDRKELHGKPLGRVVQSIGESAAA